MRWNSPGHKNNVGIGQAETSFGRASANPNRKRQPMLYAILAYHVEEEITALTPEEDAALMENLHGVHGKLNQTGRLGPAVRLGATKAACVLRGPGKGAVTDGPFTETKEQLLGFYVIDCADRDAAIAAARDLRRVNPSAMYEIRPVLLYRPGMPLTATEAGVEATPSSGGRN
jgi:hypothetical protein